MGEGGGIRRKPLIPRPSPGRQIEGETPQRYLPIDIYPHTENHHMRPQVHAFIDCPQQNSTISLFRPLASPHLLA